MSIQQDSPAWLQNILNTTGLFAEKFKHIFIQDCRPPQETDELLWPPPDGPIGSWWTPLQKAKLIPNIIKTFCNVFRLSKLTPSICNLIPGATPSPPPPRESPQQHLLVQARQGKRSPSPGRAGCCARSRTLRYKLRSRSVQYISPSKSCWYALTSRWGEARRGWDCLQTLPFSPQHQHQHHHCYISAILPDTAFDLTWIQRK